MYAIVQAGGRQVKVAPGGFVTVDRLDKEPGAEVSFDRVLVVAGEGGEITTGDPFVADARVLGVVEGEARGPKIRVFIKKRRKGSRRTLGHRSRLTRVRVTEIVA